MIFKIEKNVPIPALRRDGRSKKYPTSDLQVGDSFLIPNGEIPNSGSAGGTSYYQRALGMRFARRKVAEGLRIWRIK
jgi:hypothetical protein